MASPRPQPAAVIDYSDHGVLIAATFAKDDGKDITVDPADAQKKYAEERDKRVRKDGPFQYLSLQSADQSRDLSRDPWVELERHEYGPMPESLRDGDDCEILVLGAGFGGILASVRLIQAGISIDDLRIVDTAAGFGGAWYWNRYPGLMCDTESYIYLPLLEEMGYVPKHKYSYGHEIRGYINKIVDKFDLRDKASLRTEIKRMSWDDEKKRWAVQLKKLDHNPAITVSAHFVIAAGGVLNTPKVPKTSGIESFRGPIFHTSRWDYGVTGGSQMDPSMQELKDKVVGIVGTGATALQVIPELAKWAKKLYVIQRTPMSVDSRGQHATDPAYFAKEIANSTDWQRKRNANFNDRLCNWPNVPDLDLVADSWTSMHSYKALIGGPNPVTTPDTIPTYAAALHALDFDRQERIRQRITSIVEDAETAKNLQPWYAGFCKRPSFHDDFLLAFNQPNVELVDTNGKGIDQITDHGIIVGDSSISMDILILGTGYQVGGSDTMVSNMPITGREGREIKSKFERGWSTLHGQLSRNFPNHFIFCPLQSGAGANHCFVIDQQARHAAYILTAAKRRAGEAGEEALRAFTVEPTEAAEEDWANQCAMRAGSLAAMAGCTPSYMNAEGATDQLSPAEQMKMARIACWGHGLEDFLKIVERWREADKLEGIQVVY